MNNKENGLDTFMMYLILGISIVVVLFIAPIYLTLVIPFSIILLLLHTSSSSDKDEFREAKKNIIFSTLFVVGMSGSIYFIFSADFIGLNYFYQGYFYVYLALFLLFANIFIFMYRKKFFPLSFLKDSDIFVQQTMYADYKYMTLKDKFLYRGTKFINSKMSKLKAKDIKSKNIRDIKSTELSIFDIEVEAVNKKGELLFYYQKLLYDFYNLFFMETYTIQNVNYLKMHYGYSLTCSYTIENEKEFENKLQEVSLLYSKIWEFLKLDMKKVNVHINIIKVFENNRNCLELSLLFAIEWMRFYVNFPVGDLAKYVKTVQDRNFLSAFSSMPTDYKNIQSTTIKPMGIGYYYLFYQLHLDAFNDMSDDEFVNEYKS